MADFNKKDNKRFLYLIVLAIFNWVYRVYFELTTIGGNIEYLIYILLIPTISGAAILAIIYRTEIVSYVLDAENIIHKGLLILYALIIVLMFSFLSIGLVSRMAWNYTNWTNAKNNPIEVMEIQLTDYKAGSRYANARVIFNFKGKRERLSISKETYHELSEINAEDIYLRLKVRKGIMGSYLLEDMRVRIRINS